jgi:hypothetical protein
MTIHATARELMTAMSEGVATATLFSMPPPAPLPEYQIQPRDGLAQAAHQQHLTISLLAMDAS